MKRTFPFSLGSKLASSTTRALTIHSLTHTLTHSLTHSLTDLVTVGMSANHNRLLPAGDKTRNIAADDGLTEHSPSENIPDSTIGRLPHHLETKLCRGERANNQVNVRKVTSSRTLTFHSLLIWGDGGTLDTNIALLDSMSTLHGNYGGMGGVTLGSVYILNNILSPEIRLMNLCLYSSRM